MIPKINSRGQSFKGVAAYLVHDKDKAQTSERMAWSDTGNLRTNDIEKAALVMAWTDKNREDIRAAYREKEGLEPNNAGRKGEAGNVYHHSIAWAIGETPSEEHQREAALDYIKAHGLEDHQFFMVAHEDTKHAHVHVVINLVHHETGLIHDVGLDKKRAQTWALEYEREHGLHCHKREENALKREQGQHVKHQDTKQDYSASVTRAYYAADDGKSFANALQAEGLELAPARRGGGFVLVDEKGDIQKLGRQLDIEEKGKAKTAAINNLLKDIERESLPDADLIAKQRAAAYKEQAAQQQQEERTQYNEIQEDTAQRVEEFEELAQNPMSDLQSWVDEDIQGRENGNDQNILSSGSGGSLPDDNALRQVDTDQGESGYFDRDRYEAERQDALELAALSYAENQEAVRLRGAAITKQLKIEIKREGKGQYNELREAHREEWKSAKSASRGINKKTILETYEPEIATHKAEKARLEGISSSVLASVYYRWREGQSVKDAIEAERKTIENAQQRLDDSLKIMENLKARHEAEREALKEEIDGRLGDAAGEGIAQAKAEQQEALLNEAQNNPEAAQRVANTVQAKTTQGRGKVAKIKTLAREHDGKEIAAKKSIADDVQKKQQEHQKSAENKAETHNKQMAAMNDNRRKKQGQSSLEHWENVGAASFAHEKQNQQQAIDKTEVKPEFDRLSRSQDGTTYTPDEIETMKREQYIQTLRGDTQDIEQDQGHEPER